MYGDLRHFWDVSGWSRQVNPSRTATRPDRLSRYTAIRVYRLQVDTSRQTPAKASGTLQPVCGRGGRSVRRMSRTKKSATETLATVCPFCGARATIVSRDLGWTTWHLTATGRGDLEVWNDPRFGETIEQSYCCEACASDCLDTKEISRATLAGSENPT
jgi:hypothetical protein